MREAYRFITRQTKDTESKEQFAFPVEYMYVPMGLSLERIMREMPGCIG